MKKITVIFCHICLCMISFPSMSESLWDIAKPIEQLAASGDPVFSFLTPSAHQSITVAYRFYTSSACTGSFFAKTYASYCIDETQANKTYHISEASLYEIMQITGVRASSVRCLRQVSPLTPLVGGAGSCSDATTTCSSPSQPFATQTLVSQGGC